MKHVFYIQNNIAYVIARQYIKDKGIEKDSIFLFGRNYRPSENPVKIVIDLSRLEIKNKRKFWQNWKKIKEIESFTKKLVLDIIIEPYIFYTTSFTHYHTELIRKHPHCVSYAFIEEGISSYFTFKELSKNIFSQIRNNPMAYTYRVKVLLNHMFKKGFDHFQTNRLISEAPLLVALSNLSFPERNNQFIVVDKPFRHVAKYSGIKHLFAPSYPVEKKLVPIDKYLNVLQKLMDYLISHQVDTLYIKFHPVHQKSKFLSSYKEKLQIYNSKVNVIELDLSDSLEDIAQTANPTIYTDMSSIALYGQNLGCNIKTITKLIISEHPRFKKVISTMPVTFTKILLENGI